MTDDGIQLVGLVPDPGVMCDGDPAPTADSFEPLLIGAIGTEMIAMTLDAQAGRGEDVWEDVT